MGPTKPFCSLLEPLRLYWDPTQSRVPSSQNCQGTGERGLWAPGKASGLDTLGLPLQGEAARPEDLQDLQGTSTPAKPAVGLK